MLGSQPAAHRNVGAQALEPSCTEPVASCSIDTQADQETGDDFVHVDVQGDSVAAHAARLPSAVAEAGREWQLIWGDEFDGDSLDRSKWGHQWGTGAQYHIQGWGNNEMQWYTDLPQNLRLENSCLVIEARHDLDAPLIDNQPFTSARIRTYNKFAIGPSAAHPTVRIEARIKVPAGLGLWPAFWMLPEDDGADECSGKGQHGHWAASGEIDIMETSNDARRLVATLHYGGQWPLHHFHYNNYSVPQGHSLADDFHVYCIEWEAKQMRWYIDDRLYAVQNSGNGTRYGWYSLGPEATDKGAPPLPDDAPFGTQRFHILLNLALGAEETTFTKIDDEIPVTTEQLQATLATPKAMLVDWVRVYGAGHAMR